MSKGLLLNSWHLLTMSSSVLRCEYVRGCLDKEICALLSKCMESALETRCLNPIGLVTRLPRRDYKTLSHICYSQHILTICSSSLYKYLIDFKFAGHCQKNLRGQFPGGQILNQQLLGEKELTKYPLLPSKSLIILWRPRVLMRHDFASPTRWKE
jgi:hypothetical protein